MQAAFIALMRAIREANNRLKWATENKRPDYTLMAIRHDIRELEKAYEVLKQHKEGK